MRAAVCHGFLTLTRLAEQNVTVRGLDRGAGPQPPGKRGTRPGKRAPAYAKLLAYAGETASNSLQQYQNVALLIPALQSLEIRRAQPMDAPR